MLGFDRRELVTIPSLHDAQQWETFQSTRLELRPNSRTRMLRSATKNKDLRHSKELRADLQISEISIEMKAMKRDAIKTITTHSM
jgi:hypothetical protein